MSRKSTQPLSAPIPRLRFVILATAFLVWAAIIAGRLIWLQVFRHADYATREIRQQQRAFQIAPRRGVLYDRNLRELAMTALVDSVYAVPSEIADKQATAKKLAAVVHGDPKDRYTTAAQIGARLRASRNFAWVARKVDSGVATRVRALNLRGVYLQKEFKRSYPDNNLAAQILGYVSLDDNGLGGLEYRYDRILHGKPGRVLTAVDARRQALGSVQRDPQAGENLVLTLDEHIQFIAEQALDHAMERTKAANGTIVVQDPSSGQILALAIRPTFNPNSVRHVPSDLLRDNAVSGVYEPGSVFKLVTYSAALNEHVITPDSMINCLGGQINVAGRMVHDDRDAIRYESRYHNVISATEALEQSSDVAAIELAERLGKDRFYQYIRAAGFGGRTGIELPAETRGLLKPPMRWNPTTIGSIPMGQEVGVTPIQLVSMVSMIANGGMYLPPHIILQSSSEAKGGKLMPEAFHPGHELPDPLPAGAHRVISTMTAAEMRKMMQAVVLHGTGIPAQLNGYSAAGKTGTAQKIDPRTHTYSKTKYIASFAGFAPVNDPAITVVVVMDSPQYSMHYGTSASAPVFHEMAQQILEYLGVPHDEPLKSTNEIAALVRHAPAEDAPAEHLDDLSTLFAEVNHLPADDPLRAPARETVAANADADEARAYEPNPTRSDNANGSAEAQDDTTPGNPALASDALPSHAQPAPAVVNVATAPVKKGNLGPPVTVPNFAGQPMRSVVGTAANLGLNVRVYGNGLASDQAPAAGTQVPAGTAVVVRFH
ncbi:MAG TPA: penicillin-binding transpeptidase domain-containing protein [Acidobacteriaceae bacterium]|nr:penicillin-binding transpeptidase domain-containing protein [Acidobacteriaceae bacterium]